MNNDWIPFGQPVRYTFNHSPYRRSHGWLLAWRSSEQGIEYLTHDGIEVIGCERLEFN